MDTTLDDCVMKPSDAPGRHQRGVRGIDAANVMLLTDSALLECDHELRIVIRY